MLQRTQSPAGFMSCFPIKYKNVLSTHGVLQLTQQPQRLLLASYLLLFQRNTMHLHIDEHVYTAAQICTHAHTHSPIYGVQLSLSLPLL